MAVLQGVRLRTTPLPAARPIAGRTRAAAPATIASTPRVRPMGLVMAAIVAATLLGLVYLTQTLGSNATSSEIGQLEIQRADLQDEIRRHQSLVLRKSDADEIKAQARRLKLKPLAEPITLSAP